MAGSATTTPEKRRPADLSAAYNTVLDWLAANGVDEWLPQQVNVLVDEPEGTLTYTAFPWDGERGWDPEHIGDDAFGDDPRLDTRTVPLQVVPDPLVVAAVDAVNREASEQDTGDRFTLEHRRAV